MKFVYRPDTGSKGVESREVVGPSQEVDEFRAANLIYNCVIGYVGNFGIYGKSSEITERPDFFDKLGHRDFKAGEEFLQTCLGVEPRVIGGNAQLSQVTRRAIFEGVFKLEPVLSSSQTFNIEGVVSALGRIVSTYIKK